ncbi:hypothetical protein KBY93_14055 [Synechococcus sp. J7-Johnson]|nr:hypothetical protein [Synechococcus sp. J7-Johnson]MCP9841745.1 hypothetical protein [Synechococcus sp. J7-Johnson]
MLRCLTRLRLLADPGVGGLTTSLLAVIETPEAMEAYRLAQGRGWLKA